MPFAPSSFLLLVVRPGAPSSVLAPPFKLALHDFVCASFQAVSSSATFGWTGITPCVAYLEDYVPFLGAQPQSAA